MFSMDQVQQMVDRAVNARLEAEKGKANPNFELENLIETRSQ